MKQLLIIFHLCLALLLVFIIPVYSYAAETDLSFKNTEPFTVITHTHGIDQPELTGVKHVE